MVDAPIRVGLAGYAASRTLHAPFVVEAGGEVAAVATTNPERIASAREDFPNVAVVDDLDALLARDDLDLVVITTPSGLHVDHALAAIRASRPFVIEKPLATSAEESRRIVAEARSAGVPFALFQQRRWDAGPLTATAVAASGELGDMWRLEFNWQRWRPEPLHRWREEAPPSEGGGILLDLGAHIIDYALLLMGPATSVYAEVRSRLSPADDEFFVALAHRDGGISHLTGTSTTAMPLPRLRVLGSRGAYVYHDMVEESYAYPFLNDADDAHAGWIIRGRGRTAVPKAAGGHGDFYRGVFSALRTADPQAAMPVAADAGVRIAEVIDAARVSSAARRVVELGRPA